MYGPAAAPPPVPSRRGPGAGGMVVRLLFAAVPLLSLGLLSWVPSLRFAVIRGRRADWAVLAVFVVLTAVYVVLLVNVPANEPEGEEGTASLLAGLYMVLLFGGATVHAVLGDRFPRDPAPYPLVGHSGPPSAGYPAPYAAAPAAGPGGYGYPGPTAPVPSQPQPQPQPPQPPSTRMRQVASELDELDALLRGRRDGHGQGSR
ncbi:hypothetical protein V1L54_03710 [Streptomyces sp. TRM 70361]|uniref:hypothetical protein n=1 Tax=Streptomyces sp. TRM 70361 TaxID=3116553 RepID=UPI002E7C3032|nr:hypothetical protein [Streptomyces sp. TRM 70361]MEE1938526.1 hypothetical protein [Streptomyces sp. TRM 70361]